MKRWGEHRPLWQNSPEDLARSSAGDSQRFLQGVHETKTVVVGAGITGLTLAFNLTELGHKVIVVSQGEIGGGTTGSSTGHLTQILDKNLDSLIHDFGVARARDVVKSLGESISTIERNVQRFN